MHEYRDTKMFYLFCRIIFSLVGILATLRWIYSWGSVETSVPNDICNAPSSEPVCPWKHVFSDLAQRLHLIEMAFKDQVVAREAIAQEVVNQSDLNGVLDQKLSVFINKVEDLHLRMNKLENRMLDLHARVISDGTYALSLHKISTLCAGNYFSVCIFQCVHVCVCVHVYLCVRVCERQRYK